MMYKHRFFAWTMSVSLLLLFVPLAGATTYYVSVSSGDDTNSGLSWAEAKAGIQPAIDLTSNGDSVLVSNGLYEIGYNLQLSISNAISLTSMHGPTNTIIDGSSESSGAIIHCSNNNAIVSGFAIQNRSIEYGQPVNGAGVFLYGGLLTNCIIKDNKIGMYAAQVIGYGAGIHCVNAEICNCQIISNICESGCQENGFDGFGGGIYAINSTIRNCLIEGNVCIGGEDAYPEYGGGVYNGTGYGGGIYGDSSSAIYNCVIKKNRVTHYGGGAANVALHNCTVVNNTSDSTGGGTYQGSCDNCIVYYNTASSSPNHHNSTCSYTCSSPTPSGSGNLSSDPMLANLEHPRLLSPSPCINRGINRSWMSSSSDIHGDPRIVDGCVDIGADEYYAPGCTGDLAVAILVDSVLGHRDEIIDFTAEVSGAVSDYFWSFGDGSPVVHGLSVTHAFSNAGNYNVVLTASNQSTSISATQRIIIVTSASLYVATNGSDSASGLSWDEARATISSAVNDVSPNETVLVSNGTYFLTGQINLNKVGVTLQSINGPDVTIIQGCSTTRCVNIGATGVVVQGFTIRNGGDVLHGAGVYMTDAVLRDCILLHNQAGSVYDTACGGGVYVTDGSVFNCTFISNNAHGAGGSGEQLSGMTGQGGGMYAVNAIISNCQFIGNQACGAGGLGNDYGYPFAGQGGSGRGGGIYVISSRVVSCEFHHDHCSGGGGGYGGWDYLGPIPGGSGGWAEGGSVYAKDSYLSDILIMNSYGVSGCGGGGEFPGDNGFAYGGGLYTPESIVSNAIIQRCTVTGACGGYAVGGGICHGSYYNSLVLSNQASHDGAGAYGAELYNCTVVDNTANSFGGGMYHCTGINSIIYFNIGPGHDNEAFCHLQHCCTLPAPSGAGNISDDPEFTDRANGDYTLSATSPCVNNGTNEAWMVGAKDLAGNDRIQNVCVDMGAFESPYWGHFSDVDHDGCTDYDEMTYLGTDATNTDSCLGLLTPFTTTGEDGVVIQWQSTTGVLYDVSRVTGLSDPLLFTTLATNVPGQVDSTSYTDTTASAESACFYRISVQK